MKILFVTPSLEVGGGQRYVSQLANHWSLKGYEVTIIVLRSAELFYLIDPSVKVIKLKHNFKNTFQKLTSGIGTALELRKNIKKETPDIVISVLSTTNILTLLSSRFLKPKIIVRDAFATSRKRSAADKLGRKLFYPLADGIIAQTEEIKQSIEKNTGSTKVKVIRNPVRAINSEDDTEREKIILTVGALNPRKGQKYLIEACSRIKAPGWRFVIIGEGKYASELLKIASNFGIQDKVEFTGSVKNVDEWLLKSSIFVLPSLYEGLPNALIEAMTAGLACISFDCETGPRDLISNGKNGFLIPLEDVDQLTNKIQTLVDDNNLRVTFGIEARASTQKFNINFISEEILAFCNGSE
jgi:GalNAc-alpha-(1->4)-GalNAc-alpha-(1->3)-diNAcBac-PP-undecaprenol alpha-1,4-N-acetyl-D-galactosaminyltransferase